MRPLFAAAAAMTLATSAFAYQAPTTQVDPSMTIAVPTNWSQEQRALYDQHIAFYPTAWTETEREQFRSMLGIAPGQWTPEQRALWQTHRETFPTNWTEAQRMAYRQQTANWATPWASTQSAMVTPTQIETSSTNMAHSTAGTPMSGGMDHSASSGSSTSMSHSTTSASLASDRIQEPGNESPERDARGIAVVSDAAFVPAGYNGIAAGQAMGGPIEGTEGEYPACSSSVTDNCIQLYERGVREALASWNRSARSMNGVGGPIEGEDEIGDNTAEDDLLDVDVRSNDVDIDGDLDGDGDNDIE